MRENEYQAQLIKRIKERFPGCRVVHNDSSQQQGIPDLTIFFGPRYAMLEVKASEKAKKQPNQDYYVQKYSEQTFCSFIYPENEEEVLNALQSALSPSG